MRIAGSRALVTGGSRGVGADLARGLVAAGAAVALVARESPLLHEVAEEIGAVAYPTDLSDAAAVRSLLDRVEVDGSVDVLVNNAAVDVLGPFAELSAEQLTQVLSVNVFAYAELTRQAVPRMLERGRGHIVNVSSLGGSTCLPGLSIYNSTKAFVNHLTMSLAYELTGTPVHLTKVEIGEVAETGLSDNARLDPDFVTKTDKAIRWGIARIITKAEVTEKTLRAIEEETVTVRIPKRLATVGLLSDLPRMLTGATEAHMRQKQS